MGEVGQHNEWTPNNFSIHLAESITATQRFAPIDLHQLSFIYSWQGLRVQTIHSAIESITCVLQIQLPVTKSVALSLYNTEHDMCVCMCACIRSSVTLLMHGHVDDFTTTLLQ